MTTSRRKAYRARRRLRWTIACRHWRHRGRRTSESLPHTWGRLSKGSLAPRRGWRHSHRMTRRQRARHTVSRARTRHGILVKGSIILLWRRGLLLLLLLLLRIRQTANRPGIVIRPDAAVGISSQRARSVAARREPVQRRRIAAWIGGKGMHLLGRRVVVAVGAVHRRRAVRLLLTVTGNA